MILFSFILFGVLILAWLAAPSSESEAAAKTVPAPALKLGEVPA